MKGGKASTTRYTIVPRGTRWVIVEHSSGDFLTREAAFEAAAGAAANAVKHGDRVELFVEAQEQV
jgi:hypothetical protein